MLRRTTLASGALRSLPAPFASGALRSLRRSSSIVPTGSSLGLPLVTAVAEGDKQPTLRTTQATAEEMFAWCTGPLGLRKEVAAEYVMKLINEGFDSPASVALASTEDLARLHIRTGHARVMLARASDLKPAPPPAAAGGLPPPRLFDYATVTANVSVGDAISAVEQAFGQLAKGKVDVPFPMHIGVDETETAGPGDCHIKGGYISGSKTWTVKLACVSFYKNLARGLPPGGGIFVVMNAETGAPVAIMQENRFLTDLRTGAAGAVSVKHLTSPNHNKIGFIGTGAIAKVMARASACVRPGYHGFAYAQAGAEEFCAEMKEELGLDFTLCSSAQELCSRSDIVFTQTPGSQVVLKKEWLRPHATVIASGSDQPTKQELPVELLKASKYVADLVGQVARVGELRSAIKAGVMTEADVHAEIGEIVNGDKPGREGNELIVVDLTGTGAQDAAIGQVAWDKLSGL